MTGTPIPGGGNEPDYGQVQRTPSHLVQVMNQVYNQCNRRTINLPKLVIKLLKDHSRPQADLFQRQLPLLEELAENINLID